MQKALTLFSVLCFFAVMAQAQNKGSRLSVGISFGPSFPVGRFASKDASNISAADLASEDGAGWAKIGVGVDISAHYRLSESVGLLLFVGGQCNKQDGDPFDGQLRKRPQMPDNVDHTIRINVSTQSWKIGKGLAGVFFTVPVSRSENLFVQSGVLAGVCKTSKPKFSYSYSDAYMVSSSLFASEEKGTRGKSSLPLTFCYQISAGLKYALTKRIALTGNINYFGARPVYKSSYYANSRIKYGLSSVNPVVGVEYGF